jgi:hypothetical protein
VQCAASLLTVSLCHRCAGCDPPTRLAQVLAGFGNASDVVCQGWVFVNSSLSEGLPLALGEAGLAGLPVVCTEVGGSRQVSEPCGGRCGA